jgi:hypothetical protein
VININTYRNRALAKYKKNKQRNLINKIIQKHIHIFAKLIYLLFCSILERFRNLFEYKIKKKKL